ncbi:MAG: hypothetical protein FWH02_01535 [Oscillospiraceae bacterium]|nr:hypothetical protein [Oscillospiraceae bacterium]
MEKQEKGKAARFSTVWDKIEKEAKPETKQPAKKTPKTEAFGGFSSSTDNGGIK